MSCASLKRKLEAEDEAEPDSRAKAAAFSEDLSSIYSLQRQAVLQLSLQKLCCVPPHSDTPLFRRVLITNTLRHIQEELSRQGAPLLTPLNLTTSAAAVAEGSRESLWGRGVEVLSRPEGSLTPAWVLEQDGELFFSMHSSVPAFSPPSLARACPPPPPPPPLPPPYLATKDGFSKALSEIEDLCPTVLIADNSTSSVSSFAASSLPSNQQYSSESSGKMNLPSTEGSEKVEDALNEPITCDSTDHSDSGLSNSQVPLSSSNCTSSSSFLPELSLDDFLFSDIDNFLCEYSPCGSGTSSAPTSSSKVISMMTDDLVRSLTGSTSGAGGGGGGSSAPLQQNQPFKSDLNELDHIMEVLVGS